MKRWMPVAVGAPGIAVGLMLAVFVALAAFDGNPFWRWEPVTLSEAAALRDAGEVVRLLRDGADPNGVYAVRAGLLYAETVEITPLAAARAAHRDEIVALLVEAGARPSP